MDIKKFWLGTLAGGVTFFFLGYLIYGVAMMDFFMSHAGSATGVMKMDDMVWWALIVGNLSWAAMIAYVFVKWANVKSFSGGLSAAAAIGFFTALGMDLTHYGTSNIMDLSGALTDVVLSTAMTAITGGVIGAVLGMGNKS